MGTRGVTNNNSPLGITMKDITGSSYKRLAVLAEAAHDRMVAAIATFATPTPSMASLATATTTLRTAIQVMGLKRNRASKAQTLAAQAAANDVRVMLQQLMSYAVNTVYDLFPQDNFQFDATLATAGFSTKNRRKPKHISQPRFVSQTNTIKFPAAMMRIKWKRGTGLLKGAPIAGYLIKTVLKSKKVFTAGYDDVDFNSFTPTSPTGLTLLAGKQYSFRIIVDGNTPLQINIDASLPYFKYQDLWNALATAIIGSGAHLQALDSISNNFFRFISDTTGDMSTVSVEQVPTIGTFVDLFSAMTDFIGIDVPVRGTETLVPATFNVIETTTRTNAILNPKMLPTSNITGQIVPFNALGEGNPINFTAQYIL